MESYQASLQVLVPVGRAPEAQGHVDTLLEGTCDVDIAPFNSDMMDIAIKAYASEPAAVKTIRQALVGLACCAPPGVNVRIRERHGLCESSFCISGLSVN